jgi:hypothetical protein
MHIIKTAKLICNVNSKENDTGWGKLKEVANKIINL